VSRAVRRAAALAPAVLLFLAACPAPAPRKTLRLAPPELHSEAPPLPRPAPAGARADVVHVVKRGETLWRIARTYGVEARELMERNGIDDPRSVAVGTELRVPRARQVLDVPEAGELERRTASPGAPPSTSSEGPAEAPRSPIATPASTTTSSLERAAEPRAGRRLAWPLKGVLYGRYGLRSGQRHDGIDIAAPEGTPVNAAADGQVIFAGKQTGYGTLVILRHDGGLVTLYAHNARVLVKKGQRVRLGQPIAAVGQTGKTTGPHLHFEVREGTRPRDPLRFLP
jgi:lipoprotein NlpD